MVKKVFIGMLLAVFTGTACGQARENWVDSIFQTLNTEEKIGQLFMPKVEALTEESVETLMNEIKQHHLGGILITGGTPVRHTQLVNKIQRASRVPLILGIAPEREEGNLLDSMVAFPKPLLLSALKNDSLVWHVGVELGRQMKQLGLHLYIGPNADIDMEQDVYPASLGYFGNNKKRVAKKSLALVKGLESAGIASVITHSSKKRPAEIDAIEKEGILRFDIPDTTHFYPYQFLMEHGVKGILASQLPYITTTNKEVASAAISELFIGDLIKKKLNYGGLVFTEIPALQHRVEKPRGGETEILAIQVGNDVLIDPQNLSAAIKNFKRALRKNDALQQRLDESVRKILATKYDAGLAHVQALSTDNLVAKLNGTTAHLLNRELARQSITLVNNEMSVLPITHLANKKFAFVSVGSEAENPMARILSKYAPFDLIPVRSPADTTGLKARLANYDLAVVAIFPLASSFLSSVLPHLYPHRSEKIVLVHLGDPRQLVVFQDYHTVLETFSDEPLYQQLAAQAIFGGQSVNGELPVSVSAAWGEGTGVPSRPYDRFSYGLPEEAGMDSKTLQQIERIAREAIDSAATPGCQVVVARKGKIVYERSFGWLTYENQEPVTDQTLYDLASLTKVSATLQTIMFLFEKGMIDLDKKISVYLPELRNSNKRDFTLRDILTHQAGLWPFLPFWADTMKDSIHQPEYYSYGESESYPFPVSENLFASAAMKDSLWQWIVRAKVREKIPRTPHDYRYSDMGFYMMQHLAEKLLNQPLEDFLEQNLYEPLGAYTLGFLPLQRFAPSRIAPTENDTLFRKSLLRGYVHDQGAAMHGGIAGHAGLFGNAIDLAKLGQVWLNAGSYGGVQFYKPETVEFFTARQFETSRRGIGWDKPTISDWNGPTSLFASGKTFGHTGFTGTCIWVDPEFDLVFVFLSNRVHPSMTNNKLLTANIRPRIQEVVYRSIFNYCQYQN